MAFKRQKSNAGLLRPFSMNFGSDVEFGTSAKGKRRDKGAPADLGPNHLLATMRTDSATTIRSVAIDDLTAGDVIVLLMGPPASGKTTFIEVAGGITGITGVVGQDVSAFRVSASNFPNSNIVLVDSPAFNDTDKTDIQVLAILSDWLNETYQRGIQLSGLIYFHRISDSKMEGISLRNWRAFEKICGEGFNKVVLTTTMWDDVEDGEGYNRERELEDFWKANIERGSSMKRFLRDRPSAADVLSPILENMAKRPLRLQREITTLNMTLKQTTAARALFLQLEAFLQECQQTLVNVRDDLKSPQLYKQELWHLEEKYKQWSFLLDRVTAGLADLRVGPAERFQRFILMSGFRPAIGILGLGKKPEREWEPESAMDARGGDPQGSQSHRIRRQEDSEIFSMHSMGRTQKIGDNKLRKRPR